jgi:threonylcarbamoyladenosine tRNA methylthiotransferase MtaB
VNKTPRAGNEDGGHFNEQGKTAAAHTLGCKANQYDTGRVLAGLSERGYTLTGFNRPAGLYIVNTCTVTGESDRKALQLIRRIKRQNPGAAVAVCGCLAKLNEAAVREAGADFVFDAREPESLYQWLNAGNAAVKAAPLTGKTRMFIKIQDGCDRFCAYCIVPYARGPVVSLETAAVLDEARRALALGAQELVLTGIQTAAYGKDLTNQADFPGLIAQVAALPGLTRLRLGSIEPYAAGPAFRGAVSHPAVCNHFHLSLQSGCDDTLHRMNRRYTAAQYAEAARLLCSVKPDTALTTDVIVGFPGETGPDFAQSLDFVRAMGFARVHVFEYSPRKGTAAAGFPGAVDEAEIKKRGKAMREVADKMKGEFLTRYKERRMPVLFESRKDGYWQGHTANYIKVRAKEGAANAVAAVRLETVRNGIAYGTTVWDG